MAIDLSDARGAYQASLMGDTYIVIRPRVIDDGAGGTKPHPDGPLRLGPRPCGFGVNTVRNAETSGDQVEHRGSYKLKILITDDVGATDQVEYRGVTYNVVWTPPISNLSLRRVVGLEEA